MRFFYSVVFIFVFCVSACQKAKQSPSSTSTAIASPLPDVSDEGSKPEQFSYQEGDTTYLMQKYFICFLKKGPNRDQTEAQTQEIQKAHLAHLESLAKNNYISMAGPFEGDGDIQGITVFHVATQAQAEALAKADPAVQAGRLNVEIHPWWAAKGSVLK